MVNKLLRSLIMTLGLSVVFAWPFTSLGVSFLSGFCFFTVLQFVVSYFFSIHNERKAAETAKRLEIERDIEFSRQFATVTCPCDNKVVSDVPIFMGENNSYECTECKKNINIDIQLKTYLQTVPVTETPDQVINKVISNASIQ